MERASRAKNTITYYSYLWKGSLFAFIVAAFTGFVYRLGMIGWLPNSLGLGLDNIRHAHSHLMFFGWAVPFPMVILMDYILQKGGAGRKGITWMKNALIGALVFGFVAYPFFLFFGYRPVEIGSASLPFSVILSGLVMVCWYGFLWGYRKVRDVLDPNISQPWFDGALLMLLVCSLGAWGVAVVQAIAPDNHLFMKSLTHFFLATFTEGWIVLVLLAILAMKFQPTSAEWKLTPNFWLGCIAVGAPMTFPYGISESLLSPMLLAVARIGGGLAAVGLFGVSYSFISSDYWKDKIWGWAVGLLAFKAVMQLVASIAPSSFWLSDHGLRIFYLHVLLLGAMTLMMTAWLQNRSKISNSYFFSIVISVFLVLISLLLPTQLWPQMWAGIWIFYVLAAAALLPTVAIIVQWIAIAASKRVYDDA